MTTPSLTVWQDNEPSTSSLPGSPADQANKLRGPWMETQLAIAFTVGITSFLVFCFLRTRSKVLYAPRTLLKGFSPHEVHSKNTFFGWILPTLRTSEFTVLQIVGLDAAVLLNFFKASFYFFAMCTLLAAVALVPINWRENGTTEGVPPPAPDPDDETFYLFQGKRRAEYEGSTLYLTSHLVFTYIFSLLALYQLYRTYRSFIHTRQLFSLDHALSTPGRSVVITSLPLHLRNEKILAQYWEDLGLRVESVSVGRNVGALKRLLEERTTKLLALETAWLEYVGNPVSKKAMEAGYDRDRIVRQILDDGDGRDEGVQHAEEALIEEEGGRLVDVTPPQSPTASESNNRNRSDVEAGPSTMSRTFEIPGKKRPEKRTRILTNEKTDLLNFLAHEYRAADEAVKKRRSGKFRPANVAFVTFADIGSAQIAAQVAHYPQPNTMITKLAPDPRDVHWHNMLLSPANVQARQFLVLGATVALLLTWAVPVSALARLLSYDAIKETAPWVGRQIDKNARLRVLVQNSLPSLALIAFNALLPFLLDWLAILQGLRSRSEIEYSLLTKYHFFLLINGFFIVLAVSTWSLARELADQPIKLINKLALSLPGARNFFISYVILQGIGIMPLQLLQLAVILPRWFYRLIWTRSPRDFAELNTPPVISLGTIYPQALLIFLICLTYSVIAPLILLFGTIYFGMGYLVYKYKLLFVYFRPYESRGQAWPLSFVRVCVGLIIFQLFMTGLFALRQAALLSFIMVPLIAFTLYTSWALHKRFAPLATYVNLAQAAEVKRAQSNGGMYEAGALASDVERLRKGHPVTESQTELNRGRYERAEETMYVVKQDQKTDYAQPPMSESFYGVLNTGRRRYNHPAISGQLPQPWLPAGRREYNRAAVEMNPGSSDIEIAQEPLDIDLDSSGAVLIDIRRRFKDLSNVTKRIAVKGVETIRSTTPKRSSTAFSDNEFMDTTRAWAGNNAFEAQSEGGRSGQSGNEDSNEEGDDEDDDHENGYGHGSRYTYFPHRKGSSREATAEPEEP